VVVVIPSIGVPTALVVVGSTRVDVESTSAALKEPPFAAVAAVVAEVATLATVIGLAVTANAEEIFVT
jgi:hypothetical protein